MNEFSTHLEIAKTASKIAGQILLKMSGNARIEQKQSHNLVTEADLKAESAIVDEIQNHFPDHKFFREEGKSTGDVFEDHVWIIDPLDGTNNFAHGIPQYSVSVAYACCGVVKAGVVYDPCRDELFASRVGGDITLNDELATVSQRPDITQSIISTGFYYDRGDLMQRTLATIERLFKNQVRGIRRFGSAALDLAWVACGRFDGFFEYQLAPWDYSAGWFLVEQAGGHCFGRDGQPMSIDAGNILACNSRISEQFLDLVRWR
ncbi:inositol monophosphatase [Vicingaceae bacterium]|nr:inositol monophosphatase [Vicingaceae bacterium]